MEDTKDLLSINKMAQICGISRQTLILYDKQDVFKPVYVTKAGYRKYSVFQIPYLREICFLKSVGIPLHKIKQHLDNRDSQKAIEMLQESQNLLENEIQSLERKKAFINQRLDMLGHIGVKFTNLERPYFEWRAETKDILSPFEKDPIDKAHLHLTLMKGWRRLLSYNMVPSESFGALIRYDSETKTSRAVGCLVGVPFPDEVTDGTLHTMKAANYAVMYKYGMPYDLTHVNQLIDWVHEQGYEVDGDILDLCLLDTTFYDNEHSEDFCKLYVPVKRAK